MDDEEVGEKFCQVLSILSEKDPSSCVKAWNKAKTKEITDTDLNEFLNETYGNGLAHKTKDIILAIIQTDQNAQ